jgi:hypothetical protein
LPARSDPKWLAVDGFKRCKKCERVLPVDQFYKKKGSADGCGHKCKECQGEHERERYRTNPERREQSIACARDWYYDTGRALRDIEAKRMILTRWRTACNQAEVARVNGAGPEEGAWEKIAGALELDARSLAAVWDDHADYKEAWAL